MQKVYDGMAANPCISNASLVFPDVVFHNISILEVSGKSQFDTFLSSWIIKKIAIDTIVSKKQFVHPRNVYPSSKNKKDKIKSMTIKGSIIYKLRSTLEHKEENKQLLQDELFVIAQSITETPTTLYQYAKSAILKRLPKSIDIPRFADVTSAHVVELSAIILIKAKCDISTFHELLLYYTIT